MNFTGEEKPEVVVDPKKESAEALVRKAKEIIDEASIVASYADIERFEKKPIALVTIQVLNDNKMIIERNFKVDVNDVVDAVNKAYEKSINGLKNISNTLES